MTPRLPRPTPPGRPSDPAIDRALLRVVRRLLEREGPGAVTMQRVALEAGVSKVTVYRRFADRQRLLEAVVAHDAEQVNRALLSAPRSAADVPRQLETYIVDLTAFLSGPGHRRYVQVLAELPPSARDARLIWMRGPERGHAMLASFLQAAHAAGHLQCTEPADSAELLLGMALGLDLVRSMYRVPLARLRPHARHVHAAQVVDLFMRLNAPDDDGRGGSALAR